MTACRKKAILGNNARKVSRTLRMAMVSGHQRHMIWAWGGARGSLCTSSKRTLDQMTQDKYDNGDRAEARLAA